MSLLGCLAPTRLTGSQHPWSTHPIVPLGRIGRNVEPGDFQGPLGFVAPITCELTNQRLHLPDEPVVFIMKCVVFLKTESRHEQGIQSPVQFP